MSQMNVRNYGRMMRDSSWSFLIDNVAQKLQKICRKFPTAWMCRGA